jgi:hypothetical protein
VFGLWLNVNTEETSDTSALSTNKKASVTRVIFRDFCKLFVRNLYCYRIFGITGAVHILSTAYFNTQTKLCLNLPMFGIIFARMFSRLLNRLVRLQDRFSIYSTIEVATIVVTNALVLVRC